MMPLFSINGYSRKTGLESYGYKSLSDPLVILTQQLVYQPGNPHTEVAIKYAITYKTMSNLYQNAFKIDLQSIAR